MVVLYHTLQAKKILATILAMHDKIPCLKSCMLLINVDHGCLNSVVVQCFLPLQSQTQSGSGLQVMHPAYGLPV